MQEAKPGAAAANAGHREIVIMAWKPYPKGTLVGFFAVTLPSGLVLHDLMLHSKGDARWIGFPAREWVNQSGAKQYARLIKFTSRAVADKFRDAVLAALDRYLQGGAA
jgi:hypothetical protein